MTDPPEFTAKWGPVAVSVLAMAIFLAAMIVAWWTKSTALDMLLGGAMANAGVVVNYWLGSSSGSKSKDATIAAKNNSGVIP